jgi:hypothetical protein
MTAGTDVERRVGPDRRVRAVSLRYPERRSGFDRRTPRAGRIGLLRWRLLGALRRSPATLAVLLAAFAVLNAADVVVTLRALDLGATELNPVMASLVEAGPVQAAVLKAVVTAAVIAGIWLLRRYQRILELALLLAVGMAVLLAYQVGGLLLVG